MKCVLETVYEKKILEANRQKQLLRTELIKNTSVGKTVEQLEPSYIAVWNVK